MALRFDGQRLGCGLGQHRLPQSSFCFCSSGEITTNREARQPLDPGTNADRQ